nr:hypothetical protein [Caloranaerobacter azorensis]
MLTKTGQDYSCPLVYYIFLSTSTTSSTVGILPSILISPFTIKAGGLVTPALAISGKSLIRSKS